MLDRNQKIAVYMDRNLDPDYGKMGFGVMRYTQNPVVCVIDSEHAGKSVNQACELPFTYPIVASIDEAADLGAEVLVLGAAPPGGRIDAAWQSALQRALDRRMSIINGLHDRLNEVFAEQLQPGQWIWDVRQPAFIPDIATARAARLNNKRVLLVGTEMAIGKMTAGLEIYRWIMEQRRDIRTAFLATGQIGITITGQGIPLDAFKVDHACGAVEHMVMEAADNDIVFIEGQGSILHPGSTATLPLMRGSCATHLIMCHRAGMTHLRTANSIRIPPLREFIQLNEALASACGALTPAKTVGIALNTSMCSQTEAEREIARLEDETGLPVTDPVRMGPEKIARALVDS